MKDFQESNVLTDPVSSAACPQCGSMLDVDGLPPLSAVQCPECQFEFQVPARFGSFMLLQLLGAGGMGGVYRARDEGLNREVAIKVMLKSLGDDPQFVESFQREAQAAAKLNHRHIAQIYSFGQERGQPYIAMELVSGGSLDDMMSSQGPLDPAAVIQIGLQVAEGLSLAAEAGMVHGDIKPENILFDGDKNAKLVDFGLSAMQSGPGNDVWGTPYYIAPEKVRRQKVDFRSDIYSLGGTLYHAITGMPPFEGEDATAVVKARFDGPPKPLREIRQGVPPEVEALIQRMLAVEPQTRYPTYGSLMGDMKRYLAKAGPIRLDRGSKRIMIKGKSSATSGGLDASGTLDELPPGMTGITDIEDGADEGRGGNRGCRMFALLGLGLFILAGLLTAGGLGVRKLSQGKKAKFEREQVMESQTKARTAIAKSVASAKGLVERVQGFVPEAMGYAQAAADEVAKVLGEETRAAMTPPEPDYAESEAPADQAAPAVTDPDRLGELLKRLPPEMAALAQGLDALPPAEALAKVEEAAKLLPPDKLEGIAPFLAEFKTLAAGGAPQAVDKEKPKGKEPKDEEPKAEEPKDEEPKAEEPKDEAEGLEPVVVAVRAMYQEAYSVKQAAVQADNLLKGIEQQAHEAEKFSSITVEDAENLAKLSNALVDRVKAMGDDMLISEAPRRVSQLKRTLETVKTDLASLVSRKRLEALEEQKRKEAEAEAEKKRLAAEAHAQKVVEEKERVKTAEAEVQDDLKQLKFREVARALRRLKDELETDEAQELASLALDRANRMKEFLDFLVTRGKGYRSSRGWSIDNADINGLTVGGRNLKWTDIFEKRMDIVGELINGLVRDDQATRDLRLSARVNAMANAALYLNLFYKEVESAQELARNLATTAAGRSEIEAETIKQLLPEFFE